MNYTLTIQPRDSYLHVIITGANTKENVMGYLEDIRRACDARDCRRVLIEERLEGPRLETLDIFKIAAEGSVRAAGMFEVIAYVDVNAETNLMHFAENVAVNRALPVRVFPTVAAAEKWLQNQSRDKPETRA